MSTVTKNITNAFFKMFSSGVFVEVFDDINDFTQALLSDYLNKDLQNGEKVIYDAVWGNIELSKAEMVIIDSPIIQRLKRINHLGLSDYVYPGSTYSRFYHTLGVISLSGQMANAINKRNLGIDEKFKEAMILLVRYAAIFHDTGHMLYSHASEHFFSNNEEALLYSVVQRMKDEFIKKTKENVALHEILSCMIVNSKAVKEMMNYSFKQTGNSYLTDDIMFETYIDYITCLIVGVAVDKQILPYKQIINGSIDADKCDYLTRDSYMTKVPVAVDVDRLIQKLCLVSIKGEDITLPLIWNDSTDEKEYLELAIKDSAEKTLFQLCMARDTMYGSVYYHQKVLTVETTLRNILKVYQDLFPDQFNKFSRILKLSDDLLGDKNIEYLLCIAKNEDYKRKHDILSLANMIRALKDRTLCKRVLNFKNQCLEGNDEETMIFFRDIIRDTDSSKRNIFLRDIKIEYFNCYKILYGKEPENVEMFFVHQPMTSYDQKKVKVHIDIGSNKRRDYRGYSYLESKESNDKEFLLVTNQQDRVLVMLAAEKVLFDIYNVKLKDECFACLKRSISDIDKTRRCLYESGYYDGPQYVLISKGLLYSYQITLNKLKEIENRFATYEGPNGYKVTLNGVENFLKQFMASLKEKSDNNVIELLRGIVHLLKNAKYIDRGMFVNAFLKELKKKEFEKYNVCTVGKQQDSGVHFAYFLNDIKNDMPNLNIVENFEQWFSSAEDESAIFFDDGSYSGKQILSIFQEYMGIPKDERVTAENHVCELNDHLKDKLKNTHIILFFVCFNVYNKEELLTGFSDLGLIKIEILYANEMNSELYDSLSPIVKNTLKTIGLSLIKSIKADNPNWSNKRIEEAALGYNNAKQMVISKSSVPTYTLSAFWIEKGYTDNGINWKPLFKRTPKP